MANAEHVADKVADSELSAISSELSETEANYRYRLLANCTKVVRIFVVRNQNDVDEAFVAKKSPTRSDVFVQTDLYTRGEDLAPWTWLGEYRVLVSHDHAHHEHRSGTIPVLKGKLRDQLEWQCDVPFEVSQIKRVVDEKEMHGFHNYAGPAHPFVRPLDALKGGTADNPIRSGPTVIIPHKFLRIPVRWKQLYKATFRLQLVSGGPWLTLDPDFYCEWH